jgi:hypothetical protein
MMRKVIVGLIVVGLLAFAGQVQAIDNGTADPLGLISSAAIQPFWSAGANFTIIEITSPEFFNTTLHGVFFDDTCARDQSKPLPVTRNGILLFTPDDIGINYNGLAAIARTVNGISLVPITNDAPIHVKGHWVNLANDHIRVVDPISVAAAETGLPEQTWNPLRSGADWTNPFEDGVFHTTIILVCPSAAIANPVTGILPTASGFPAAPLIAFAATKPAALIAGVIYDQFEFPLRNVTVPCVCITPLPVLTINSVYGDPNAFTSLYYTELFTYSIIPGGPGLDPSTNNAVRTFTGYRNIVTTNASFPGGQGDQFGRLNNASASALQGMFPFVPGLR